MKNQIVISLAKATQLKPEVIHLETPEIMEFGDYSSNIALQVKSQKSKVKTTAQKLKIEEKNSPRHIAENIVQELKKDNELTEVIDNIEVAGPGFINFWLNKDTLVDTLIQIVNLKDSYGKTQEKQGKKIVVEYTDPNPFKEFHIGHLISNVTGEAFARLQEAVGSVVWRADYFGDVGTHVAKSIWGLQKKMEEDGISLEDLAERDLLERINYMGQAYALGTESFDNDEDVKKEIERLNTVLYMVAQEMWKKEGKKSVINYDPEGKISKEEIDTVYDLYKTGREWSLEYFETIYARLGTKFDGYYPESVVGEIGFKYVKDNIGKVFLESQGAVIFPGEKYGLHTRVFINKHNLPTYETKELGLAPAKHEDFKYDESIIVVGKEIKEYFAVLIEALTQVNPELGMVTKAICTGMVNLPSGEDEFEVWKCGYGEQSIGRAKKTCRGKNGEPGLL
jgi:arginyl-tRNA synthetase